MCLQRIQDSFTEHKKKLRISRPVQLKSRIPTLNTFCYSEAKTSLADAANPANFCCGFVRWADVPIIKPLPCTQQFSTTQLLPACLFPYFYSRLFSSLQWMKHKHRDPAIKLSFTKPGIEAHHSNRGICACICIIARSFSSFTVASGLISQPSCYLVPFEQPFLQRNFLCLTVKKLPRTNSFSILVW